MWLPRQNRRNRPQEHKAGHSLRRTVIILTLFVAVPVVGFGMGQQGDALARADELIAEKRYNEALAALIPFARENPRDFDAAQERIHQILFVRDQYNAVAQELLNELEQEEPSDEEIVRLTSLLFELDPQRIAETQDFIAQTREVALFKSNQRRLERILAEGQALADRGSYADALRTYSGGFGIYQTEFFLGTYGAQMENRARVGIATINGNIAELNSAATALENAVNALEALSNQGIGPQNLAGYRNAYNRLAAEMDRFTALRNTFAGTGTVFREDLAQLRQNFPREGDRNFLAFAVRLVEGNSDTSGGMLGVFDAAWNRSVPRARELLDAKSQTVYAAAVADASGQNYEGLDGRAESLAGYASFPENLEIRWGNYEMAQKTTLFNQPVPVGEAANYLKFRALAESASQWTTLGRLGSQYLEVSRQDAAAIEQTGDAFSNEEASTAAFRRIRGEAQGLANSIQQGSTEYRNLETTYPGSGSLVYINGINQATSNFINLLNNAAEEADFRRYTIANDMLENRVRSREEEFREASQYFQGTQRGDYLAKYPTRAAEVLVSMEGSLAADREAANALMGQYGEDASAVNASARLSSLRDAAVLIVGRLDSTGTQSRSMAAAARNQSADAANLRRDGDRFLTEAETALNGNDFTTAQNRLERAATAYDQSLEREDDEETWNKRNVSIFDLDNAIASALNRDVLRQVDELIGQIRDNYFRGEFDEAERLVTRAQNIWRQTQTIENPDLVYWSSMILAGLRSGRTIPPTAPLYAEMSQLLSDARKNYDEGRVLITASPQEARQMLSSAKENLVKVKLVYPMNEEAGILDLRIDQELDPNFVATLRSKIDDAVARTRTGSRNNQIQALGDLRVYQSVFPQFTNWAPIITQAEIDTGLRPRPPSREAVDEAAAIVAMAGPIVAAGNAADISDIQDDLSRAIQLDPNNQGARRLFNEAASIVRRGNLILDSVAERLFQQASQALTQQNAIGAQQLLRQIYARNDDYRYIAKVITVQQRVDSML